MRSPSRSCVTSCGSWTRRRTSSGRLRFADTRRTARDCRRPWGNLEGPHREPPSDRTAAPGGLEAWFFFLPVEVKFKWMRRIYSLEEEMIQRWQEERERDGKGQVNNGINGLNLDRCGWIKDLLSVICLHTPKIQTCHICSFFHPSFFPLFVLLSHRWWRLSLHSSQSWRLDAITFI